MSSLPGTPAALPTTQAGGTAFDARPVVQPGSQAAPLALPPGSRVVAEVVKTQGDGQVLLRLGQTLLAATLPGQFTVGQKLPLVVLSGPGTQPLLLLAPPNSPAAAQTQLSAAGQLLGRLQQAPPESGPVQRADPVWAQPGPVNAPQLANALAQSVKSSGLFYESHLAAWTQGQFPLPELLAEPQGQLSPLLARPSEHGAGASSMASSSTTVVADPQAGPGKGAAAPSQAGVADRSLAQAATTSAQSALPAVIDPGVSARAMRAYSGLQAQPVAVQSGAGELPAQLQGLVQQQLATLAQGSVLWSGQIWHGQEMQWQIEPDDTHRDSETAPVGARGWTTVLKLDLPQLGTMVVTLHLGADEHLRVSVQHGEQAASILQSRRAEFSRSLQDAGLQLDALALQPLTTS